MTTFAVLFFFGWGIGLKRGVPLYVCCDSFPCLREVSLFSAPSAPFIRNVTVLSPNSVFLQWDPPTVFYRRVDKYVLKWWDTRGNDPDTMVSGTKTQVGGCVSCLLSSLCFFLFLSLFWLPACICLCQSLPFFLSLFHCCFSLPLFLL